MSKDKQSYVAVARFMRPHGVRGEILVHSYTMLADGLFSYENLSLEDGSNLILKRKGKYKNGFIVAIEGVNDRTEVEPYVNQDIYVERSALKPIEEQDEFYIVDLVGLEVRNEEGGAIGKVVSVDNYGAGDVVEVNFTESRNTELYLFTSDIFPIVRIDDGYIVCIPPEEIIVQDNERKSQE